MIDAVTTFSGGISNGGRISALGNALDVQDVANFAGGISNGGTISTAHAGVELGAPPQSSIAHGVASFTGNIFNSGTIEAQTGIAVFDSTVGGAIIDSGTIKATSHGILIDSASEILASKIAIDIAGSTFTGGIFNFGVISGSAGIEIKTAHPVSIFDAGTIVGTGGTAIEFAGSGNTLTLGAGYTISGIVDPFGNNTLQLGGTGSSTFDLSSIGSGAQYRNFTGFDVVGGTWGVFGASTAHWQITGGELKVTGGVELISTTVHAGSLVIESRGTAISTTVSSGGTYEVNHGGTATVAVIERGGSLLVGGSASSITIISGTGSGETGVAISTTIDGGGVQSLGGIAAASVTTISDGGTQIVGTEAVAFATKILRGGTQIVSAFGLGDNGALISGGTQFDAGLAKDEAIFSGGVQIVESTGVASGTTVNAGGTEIVQSGGALSSVLISGGIVEVLSGGSANVTFASSGSGGLEIADTQSSPSAFTGTITGFGGLSHTNDKQFIDLVSVTSAAHKISFSYTPDVGSGVLTVSSGGAVVASIELIGTYSSGNFHVTAGPGGTVKITDPGVINGGSVQPDAATTFPRNGIDLPNIAFGAQTTLAYAENAAGTGGNLTVSDGRHAASIALLGNYIAGSFIAAADGHGGTLVTQAQPQQQPLLTHPKA